MSPASAAASASATPIRICSASCTWRPSRARERILDLAATQLPTGGAYHQYQPLTKRGNNDIGGGFNDDPHWLIIGVSAYIKETGDWSILDEPVQYDNEPGSEQPLYEHLQRSFHYTLDRLGPHGLPLIGRADWNDCLNLNCFSDTPGQSFQTTTNKDGKVAESVFIAGLFVHSGQELAAIAKRRGLDAEAQRTWPKSQRWIRSSENTAGTASGSCAPMTTSAPRSARRSARKARSSSSPTAIACWPASASKTARPPRRLSLSASIWPPNTASSCSSRPTPGTTSNLGEISSYPPGYKENAGIFCHVNPWVMIGETRLGHGDVAHDYYSRINPSAREEIGDLHRCEPYVYAQMIAGKDAPTFGEAKNSWLTGTAAWNYYAIVQWILGIRTTLDGLEIAPVIPKSWPGFTATRIFRGVVYKISIERKGEGNEIALTVDGAPIEGNVVTPPADGRKEVTVKGILS